MSRNCLKIRMIRLSYCLISVMLLSLLPGCGNDSGFPKVAMDEERFDFGVFEQEQKGKHEFVVRNEGDAALLLKVLDKSCFCTHVALSRSRIAPGRDARITVSWGPNSAGGGSYHQGVEIGTNDPERPRFQLFIEGVYSVPIIAEPEPVQIYAFSGQEASNRTRIFFYEKDITVNEIVSDDPEHFSATFVKSEMKEEDIKINKLKSAAAVYDVTVTFKPGLHAENFLSTFMVHSDSNLEPQFRFRVSGQVLRHLVILSKKAGVYDEKTGILNLGTTFHGTPVKESLVLRFKVPDDVTPEFRVVSKNPSWLNVTLDECRPAFDGNSILTLVIEIPADANPGSSESTDGDNPSVIVLESNIPDLATIRIPVAYVVQETGTP